LPRGELAQPVGQHHRSGKGTGGTEQLAAFQAILQGVDGLLQPVIAVLGSRNHLQDAKVELFLGSAVQQAQQLAVEPAWTLLAPLPLGHHLAIDADPHAEVLPGQTAQLVGDLLLSQVEAAAVVLQPEVRDRD
jgi:hypothetical protein